MSSVQAGRSQVVEHAQIYEQVVTADLVGLGKRIGSDLLSICLDPANVVTQLELLAECVEKTAALVKNVHVKDFAFARHDGSVGVHLLRRADGMGLHDYAQLLRTVKPRERGINEVVEHWFPWQDDAQTTIQDRSHRLVRRELSRRAATRPRPRPGHRLIPQVNPGAIVLTLDQAAPYAGLLYGREGIIKGDGKRSSAMTSSVETMQSRSVAAGR